MYLELSAKNWIFTLKLFETNWFSSLDFCWQLTNYYLKYIVSNTFLFSLKISICQCGHSDTDSCSRPNFSHENETYSLRIAISMVKNPQIWATFGCPWPNFSNSTSLMKRCWSSGLAFSSANSSITNHVCLYVLWKLFQMTPALSSSDLWSPFLKIQ